MANSTSTSAASVIEKRVSTIVTETLIQESVMMGAVKDMSAMVGPGMDRLDIPSFNELAIQDVSESAAVTAQTINPATAQLSLDRHKSIPFFITDRASVQAKLNMVQEAVKNGARSLAAEIDDYLLGLLDAGASTAAPDHRIALTASEPLTDLAIAKKLLDDANVPKFDRFVVASPGFMQSLLGDSNVINAEKYASSAPIQAGFVTRIYGFNILESSSASVIDDGFIAYQREAIAFARQIQPKFERQREVLQHGDAYSLSHLYGGIVTSGSGSRIVVADADGV